MGRNNADRIPKLRVKKNDKVYVLAGKDKGNTGKVLSVDPVRQRATVEGINMVKRHRKDTKTGGDIIEMPAAIHVSNLMVECPSCNEHMKPLKKIVSKTIGKRTKDYNVRACRSCGEQLDTI